MLVSSMPKLAALLHVSITKIGSIINPSIRPREGFGLFALQLALTSSSSLQARFYFAVLDPFHIPAVYGPVMLVVTRWSIHIVSGPGVLDQRPPSNSTFWDVINQSINQFWDFFYRTFFPYIMRCYIMRCYMHTDCKFLKKCIFQWTFIDKGEGIASDFHLNFNE